MINNCIIIVIIIVAHRVALSEWYSRIRDTEVSQADLLNEVWYCFTFSFFLLGILFSV